MEHNKLNYILIALNLAVFISYFAISNFYIKEEMKDKLELIEVYTADEDWERAKDISKEIEEDWDKKKFFIMCNYGESEFEGFEGHINDILGGVEAEDVGAALPTILSAQDAWENLNKIIPAP